MNFSTIRSHLELVQNSVASFLHRFFNSCTSQRCQVHPKIGSNQDLDFIDLGAKRVVRILHVPPKPFGRSQTLLASTIREKSDGEKRTLNLDIPSEEYWFTRANRPVKLRDDCNCNPRPSGNNLSGAGEIIGPDHSTNGNNQMTSVVGGSAINVANCSHQLIEAYADRLSREVIGAGFCSMIIRCPLDDRLALKDTSLNHWPAGNNLNDLNSTDSVTNHKSNTNPEIPNLHISPLTGSANVTGLKQTFHSSDNKMNDTMPDGKSGFVNLSFLGSMSDPDKLTSCTDDYLQLLNVSSMKSPPSQYKFEASSSLKVRSMDAESGMSTESFNIVDGGDTISLEFEKPEVGFHPDKSSISEEDCGQESMVQINPNGELLNTVDTSLVNVHDRKDQVQGNGKDSQDNCMHTKNTQKPLLLFLHGVGSSADVWSVMLEYFSDAGYEVLAPDMLGHGYSSAPNNRSAYSFDRLLQDVLQIFDRFVSDTQKCVAIGHSYGSCFAAALARYRPQQISQLVLLSSGGPSPLVPKQTLFSLHPCIVSLMKPFLMCGFKREVFYAPRGKQLPAFCTYELPPYVMNHVEKGQEWPDGDSAFHRRILVPTLLVHGLKDPHISLVEECEMERTIPRSFLEVLPNAGHMQMLDAPEQLCHMIHCFITWWNS